MSMPTDSEHVPLRLHQLRERTIRGSSGLVSQVSVGQIFVKNKIHYELCEKEDLGNGKFKLRVIVVTTGYTSTRVWNGDSDVVIK